MNKEQGGFCRSEYGIHIQQKASTRKGKCLKEVGLLGFEPRKKPVFKEVGLLGFEPRKTGPESVVLPLHHSPKSLAKTDVLILTVQRYNFSTT